MGTGMDREQYQPRRHQHGGGVEGQEHRCNGCQRNHQKPQEEHAAAAQAGQTVRYHREQAGVVQQFRQ
jgi:hypothetical protein